MDRSSGFRCCSYSSLKWDHKTSKLQSSSPLVPDHAIANHVCRVFLYLDQTEIYEGNPKSQSCKRVNTLFLVSGASLITWTPYQMINNLSYFEGLGFRISLTIFYLSKILQFSNSLVNVVIYPQRVPEFKTILKNIIHCCRAASQRPTTARSQPAVPLNRIA